MVNTSLVEVGNALKMNQNRIIAKLGDSIKWEYFCSTFLTAVEKQPKLLKCTQTSLIKAALDLSQLRLISDGVLGEAYVLPYGQTATVIVGYRGLIQLCLRSPLVKKIGARVVYQNDLFKYEYGLNEACVHVPTEEEPGEMRGVYATFEMSDGVKGFEYWPYKRLMNHKIKFAKGLDQKDQKGNYTSPWRTNEEAMCRKTAIRSICNLLPKAIEDLTIATAIESSVNYEKEEAIDIEINKEKAAETGKVLDAQKPDLDALTDEKPKVGIADASAEPPDDDDIPIGDSSPELIDEEQNAAFQARFRELKITTANIIKYLKKNDFADTSKITKERYELMFLGLDEIGKQIKEEI